MNRTEMKRHTQDTLMDGIATVLGYWEEQSHHRPAGWDDWSEERRQTYRDTMRREADRVAKLFGYESAWRN